MPKHNVLQRPYKLVLSNDRLFFTEHNVYCAIFYFLFVGVSSIIAMVYFLLSPSQILHKAK